LEASLAMARKVSISRRLPRPRPKMILVVRAGDVACGPREGRKLVLARQS
jgi:hypothetical protein